MGKPADGAKSKWDHLLEEVREHCGGSLERYAHGKVVDPSKKGAPKKIGKGPKTLRRYLLENVKEMQELQKVIDEAIAARAISDLKKGIRRIKEVSSARHGLPAATSLSRCPGPLPHPSLALSWSLD